MCIAMPPGEDGRLTDLPPGPVQSRSQHISALDGVRGIAILAVFFCHFGGGTHGGSFFTKICGVILNGGWAGVDLFFVLSGFLITNILLGTQSDPNYYKVFYARRLLRIFPIYYATLLLVLAISIAQHEYFRPDQYSFFVFLNNFAVIFDPTVGYPGRHMNLTALWSLGVEEQFYLVWPFLVALACRHNRMVWLIAAALVIPLVLRLLLADALPAAVYNSPFTRMDTFAAGALLAYLVRRDLLRSLPGWLPRTILALSVVGFALIGWFERSLDPFTKLMMTIGYEATAAGAFALIWLAATDRGLVKSVCSLAPLRFFGKYSYGIYIYHHLFIHFFRTSVWPFEAHLIRHPAWTGVVYMVSSLLIITSVAVASYHWFEAYFLRLKRYFPYQRPAECEAIHPAAP